MEFGFNQELYKSQIEFINDATKIIEDNKVAIFSSPTGTGKTLSLLSVATKFMKNDINDENGLFNLLYGGDKTRIYYCSRTHSQLSQVMSELNKNKDKYESVILGSRKIYCVNKVANDCNSLDIINSRCKNLLKDEKCTFYTNKYYDTRNFDIEDLKRKGIEMSFCPYYFAKNKASDCQIVFLPYNILFDKEARKSFKIDLKNKILIIDEAHNIYNTVIDLNSPIITWNEINNILKLKDLDESLTKILKCLTTFYNEFKLEKKSGMVMETFDFLIKSGLANYNLFDVVDYIDKSKLAQRNEMKYIFEFSKFLKLLMKSDSYGRIIVDLNKLKLTTMDPKLYFDELKECKSVLFAGGTMEPVDGLQNIFKDIACFSYDSINTNFLSFIVSETHNKKTINLNYSERDNQINDIVNSLVALSNPIKSGGVVIFLPSKYFLESIRKVGTGNFNREVHFEDNFSFTNFKNNPQILIAVMGGKLSEGINFSDNLCRLLIVVGIPYPTVDLEFKERCKHNPDYGSIMAMKMVNQAIGRAIRHKDDYSAIVLLDYRYVYMREKLSPWIAKNIQSTKFIDSLIKINKFLKGQERLNHDIVLP